MNGRGTLVYAAGASDRGPAIADHVARIRAQLSAHVLDLDVVAAEWGDLAGATLDRIDLAIPGAALAQPATSLAAVPGDPLAELRALSAGVAAAPSGTARVAGLREADRLLAIASASLDVDPGDPIGVAVRAAADDIRASAEYALARSLPVPEETLVGAAARAVVAAAARSASPETADGAAVDQAVAVRVEMHLAQTVLVLAAATLLAGYAGIDPGPGLKRWATDVLVPHRSEVMHASLLGVADVLLYLRNGDRMRRVVADALAAATGGARPVVALGNSLGSIILVNLLVEPGAPRPDLLVTVGSPAPLLETFGALSPPGTPPPFQPWLNIYDRRDFLAFVARPVWPDQPGITDVAVDIGVGFPDAHGHAYLYEPAVYDAIRDALTRLGRAELPG